MRLLILHQAHVFGGAERTTANLLTHLDRAAVSHITLAAPAALRRFMPDAYDAFVDTDAEIGAGWFATPTQLKRDVRGAQRLLQQIRPDVALGMMHYSAALVAFGARLGAGLTMRRVRTVAGFRGPAFEYMRRYEHGTRRRLFLRLAIAGTARLADRVVVPSHGTADDSCRHFFAACGRTVVIANGIDAAAVEAAAAEPVAGLEGLPAGLPLLCVAARLSEEKDVDLLIDAVRRVQQQTPCALVVVGDGPRRAALQRQAQQDGIADRVAFVGHRDNVYPYIRRADVYVHTCQFEGFGYTMLEALACGTPVIATDCPTGPREVLAGGSCGVLTAPGDAAALADAITQLLPDAARRQRLRALGLERARALTVQRMADGYLRVFRALAN